MEFIYFRKRGVSPSPQQSIKSGAFRDFEGRFGRPRAPPTRQNISHFFRFSYSRGDAWEGECLPHEPLRVYRCS